MRRDYIEPRMEALEMNHKIDHPAQVVKTLWKEICGVHVQVSATHYYLLHL